MNIKIGILFSLAVLTACTGKIDTKAEGEKLMALSREWSKSAATDSLEKTLGYWANDAVLMSPGQPAVQGKEAIRKMLEGTFKIPGFKVSWEPVRAEVSKSGEMAYLIEKGQVTMNDSLGHPVTEYHNSVSVWRKEPDGSWKNVADISTPVPVQK